ncbi:MAG: M20/M25/M40 family metallo-hydrolase [Pyrinomonadaceae bacterium]|nr:M20/M25/M40 family metallo-hydrolase [Pyrinomonadaceae bacterium]
MKKQLFSILFLLLLSLSVSAQKAKTVKPDQTLQRLKIHVSYLASDKLEGRRTGEKGATYAAGYVANMFANYKLKAPKINGKSNYLQQFPFISETKNPNGSVEKKEVASYNVIGILEGTDAVLKNEAIIIGGHYDHLGRGGKGSLAVNSTEIHHGADDNASGVSALLEIARYFAKSKNNKRTLIFIAFGSEEEGLFGSKFYTNNPVFPLDKTVAMLNMDMIGRLRENKLNVGGIGTATEWKSLVESKNFLGTMEVNGYERPITKVSIKDPQTGNIKTETNYPNFTLQLTEDGFGPSDHASFYMKKIPVLFFFTGSHEDYHKPTDTAEKINYEGLQSIKEYVQAIVSEIDANQNRPTYAVAKSSGNNDGRRSFAVTIGVMPSYTDAGDGMVIDGVRDDSPAAKAGLKAGDKIVKLAEKDVKNVQDYTAILGELKADNVYEVWVLRGTERLIFKVKPIARK